MPDDDDDDGDALVPLTVELHNHPLASSESLLAEPLRSEGGDHAAVPGTFVLRCIPRFAYGLNWGDHVLADTGGAGRTIRKVVAPSGHTTLRVTFLRRVLPRARVPMLDALRALCGRSASRTKAR